jgi:hypothetical protein
MKALIGCEKTDRRLTDLLALVDGVEAAMDYHTQVYANPVRPVQVVRAVDVLKEADQA